MPFNTRSLRQKWLYDMTLAILVLLLPYHGLSLILPGTGLVSRHSISPAVQIVVFEHTLFGTGGLVLNQPTPIRLRDLNIPRFKVFENHTLMLGCGTGKGSSSNLPVGDMAPWFWIHTFPEISKSFRLEGADGPLFMGGNLDEATALIQEERLDPFSFKFFHKYQQWKGGELEQQIEDGQWTVRPQDPVEAVRPYSLPVFD